MQHQTATYYWDVKQAEYRPASEVAPLQSNAKTVVNWGRWTVGLIGTSAGMVGSGIFALTTLAMGAQVLTSDQEDAMPAAVASAGGALMTAFFWEVWSVSRRLMAASTSESCRFHPVPNATAEEIQPINSLYTPLSRISKDVVLLVFPSTDHTAIFSRFGLEFLTLSVIFDVVKKVISSPKELADAVHETNRQAKNCGHTLIGVILQGHGCPYGLDLSDDDSLTGREAECRVLDEIPQHGFVLLCSCSTGKTPFIGTCLAETISSVCRCRVFAPVDNVGDAKVQRQCVLENSRIKIHVSCQYYKRVSEKEGLLQPVDCAVYQNGKPVSKAIFC